MKLEHKVHVLTIVLVACCAVKAQTSEDVACKLECIYSYWMKVWLNRARAKFNSSTIRVLLIWTHIITLPHAGFQACIPVAEMNVPIQVRVDGQGELCPSREGASNDLTRFTAAEIVRQYTELMSCSGCELSGVQLASCSSEWDKVILTACMYWGLMIVSM